MVAPYAVKGNNWLSLDDEESIRVKSEYIKQEGFAGGMVWSIDTDDFWGFCTGTKFGLTHTIAEVSINISVSSFVSIILYYSLT